MKVVLSHLSLEEQSRKTPGESATSDIKDLRSEQHSGVTEELGTTPLSLEKLFLQQLSHATTPSTRLPVMSHLESEWRKADLPEFLSGIRDNCYFGDTEPSHAPQDAFAALICAKQGRKPDGSATTSVDKRAQLAEESPELVGNFLDTLNAIYKKTPRAVIAFHHAKYDVREMASLIWAQSQAFTRKHRTGIKAFTSLRYLCTLEMAGKLGLGPSGVSLEKLVREWVDPGLIRKTPLHSARR